MRASRLALIGAALTALCLTAAATPEVPSTQRWAAAQPAVDLAPGLPPPLPASLRGAGPTPFEQLGALEGASYRRDGNVNDSGDFAEWEHPNRVRFTPGFNCSGHVLTAARMLADRPLSIEAIRWDRNHDSHPEAKQGQDWDFGWDVVVNAAVAGASGHLDRVLYHNSRGTAHPLNTATEALDATHLRGFSVWDHAAWVQALGALREDYFYLGSFSRVGRNGRMLHHHTVVIVTRGEQVWVQGASPKNPLGPRVESLQVTDPDELAALLSQFSSYKSEHLLILGAPLPLNRFNLVPPERRLGD